MKTPELFKIKDEDGVSHQVVGPPQGRKELVAPLRKYFSDPCLRGGEVPEHPIAEWFNLDEQGRKELIRNRAIERCAITGKPSREVHETFTRGAYGGAALVPWNMEVFTPTVHDALQQHQMEVLRFDPLDDRKMNPKKRSGMFIVIGLDGHIIKQKDIWVYQRAAWRTAEQDIIDVQNEILAVRKARWDIGIKLSKLKNSGGYQVGGYNDVYELAANYGVSSPQAKLLIRAADFANESELGDLLESVDIEVADQLKSLPEEDVVEVFSLFAGSTPAEAWDQYHRRYPPKKRKPKFRVMKREPYREVRADSIDEIEYGPDDMVITGGSVVVGITEDVDG